MGVASYVKSYKKEIEMDEMKVLSLVLSFWVVVVIGIGLVVKVNYKDLDDLGEG